MNPIEEFEKYLVEIGIATKTIESYVTYIGGLDNDLYALWGCVDEFRMYNRALTEADIQEIYDTER